MKTIKHITGVVLLLSGIAFTANASAGENSINPGIFVNPVGSGAMVEYEHLLKDKIGIGARLGTISYNYKDGSYEEDGAGSGVEFIARYYPKGHGFDGFYVGGGVGIWSIAWEWTDPNDIPTADDGTATAFDVNVNLGWKIPLGSDKIYLDPSLIVGNFFSSASDDSEVIGLYTAAHVGVGFVF